MVAVSCAYVDAALSIKYAYVCVDAAVRVSYAHVYVDATLSVSYAYVYTSPQFLSTVPHQGF